MTEQPLSETMRRGDVFEDEWFDVARKLQIQIEKLTELLRDLHAEVEMGEAVGICLRDRVPSLRAGQLLAAQEGSADG